MRLIDADFLRDLVNARLEEDWEFLPKKFLFGVRDLLDSTPTIDAVVVVRCKDCKHFKHGNIRPNFCEVFDWSNEKSDFCSFGERKTDG